MKDWFSVHGIPEILESDNGPQYSSKEFRLFQQEWGFDHQTSSPYHPRGNGLAERGVQIAKNILRKCSLDGSDIQLALLNYRNTPRSSVLGSPCQRLYSRITKTTLPVTTSKLKPRIINNVSTELKKLREKQKQYGDIHAKNNETLEVGDKVRFQVGHRHWRGGEIKDKTENQRSVIIQTDEGNMYRRNTGLVHKTNADLREEREVVIVPDCKTQDPPPLNSEIPLEIPKVNRNSKVSSDSKATAPSTQTYRTRSGRIVKPVIKLDL